MEGIEYEAYEPDPDDEYYDQACRAAYARIFSETGKDVIG